MAGKEQTLVLEGFKGLNTSLPASLIEDNELAELVNFDIGNGGELKKRPGLSRISTGAFPAYLDLLGIFKTPTFFYFIANSNSTMYRSVDGVTWTTFTGVGAHSGRDSIQYADKIYIPREGTLGQYDGTTFTEIVGSPAGIQGVAFKDRLFLFNPFSANPSRLYYSAPGNFTSWPGTNFIDVNAGDGDSLTAIVVYQDRLIIFKSRSCWTLYVQGSPINWVLRLQNSEIGCMSYRTIKEIESIIYFLGLKGVYQSDGIEFNLISDPIRDEFEDKQIKLESGVGQSIERDYAFRLEDRYVLIIDPENGTPDIYSYYFKTGGWSKWVLGQDIRIRFPVEVYYSSPGIGVYFGEREATGFYKLAEANSHLDNEVAFETKFKTKELSLDMPTLLKRGKWAAIELLGDTGSDIDISYITDNRELLTINLEELSPLNYLYKLMGPGYFRNFQLKLSETTSSDLTVLKFMLILHIKRSPIYSGANP